MTPSRVLTGLAIVAAGLVGWYAWAVGGASATGIGALPTTDFPNAQWYLPPPAGNASVALPIQGSSCTSPSGANCTIILPASPTYAWNCLTVHVANQGTNGDGGLIDNLLIEQAPVPDAGLWEQLAPSSQFAGLTLGTLKDVAFCPVHYPYIRIEGRSAAGTTATIWMSGIRF